MNCRIPVIGAALILSFPGFTSVSAQSRPPVEAFGDLPAITGVRLSPDGKYMAAVQTIAGKPVAAIYTINAPAGTKPTIVSSPDGIISYVRWVKNDRLLVVEKANMTKRTDFLQTIWRTMSISPDGKNVVKLFGRDASLDFNTADSFIRDIDLNDPDDVFVPIWRQFQTADNGNSSATPVAEMVQSSEFFLELDRVNVRDGTSKVVVPGTASTTDWAMDGHGNVVARYTRQPHEHIEHVKVPSGQDWRDLISFETGRPDTGDAYGLTFDGKSIALSQRNEQGRLALYAIDIASGKYTPLFSRPDYDIAYPIADEWTSRVIGVSYVDDKTEDVYFDPVREHIQKLLETAFPGQSVSQVSSDVAGKIYIVETDSPQEPPTYYYFDAATRHASVIGTAYPQLPPETLGVMKPYDYKARDGLDIHAYLTLPPGSMAKNLPAVVMPHGGPLLRDYLQFDWWAQFLASRGYAVLQPNFRGSDGYGKDFAAAGNGQWGLKMQDDLTDGVKKLVADGIADPKRICIVGAENYGGYSALAGAAFSPNTYACAVSFAGASDLDRMLTRDRKLNGYDSDTVSFDRIQIGDPGEDSARLAATSPVLHADKINIPVLLMHATDDTTTPIEQSQAMNDALVGAGKNVKFLPLDGGDHFLDLAATRIQVLTEMEKFLDTYIGASAARPATSH